MTRLLALRLFVRFWRKALAISGKLPARVWNALAAVSILILILSIAGLLHSQSGCKMTIVNKSLPLTPINIEDVLRAHNVPQNPDALSAFVAEGERLTSRPAGIDKEMPSFFERQVSVAIVGNTYKRHTADPLRQREQVDLFDGSVPYHAVSESGRLAEATNQLADSQARGVEFSVKTFSLVPVLTQLADPATEQASPMTAASIIPDHTVNERIVFIREDKKEPSHDASFWISLFGAIVSTGASISNMILAWIANNRAKAELMLKIAEANQKAEEAALERDKVKLEILKLQLEIDKAKGAPLVTLT